jgi:hypothetical protein
MTWITRIGKWNLLANMDQNKFPHIPNRRMGLSTIRARYRSVWENCWAKRIRIGSDSTALKQRRSLYPSRVLSGILHVLELMELSDGWRLNQNGKLKNMDWVTSSQESRKELWGMAGWKIKRVAVESSDRKKICAPICATAMRAQWEQFQAYMNTVHGSFDKYNFESR